MTIIGKVKNMLLQIHQINLASCTSVTKVVYVNERTIIMKRKDFSITELKYPWKLTEMVGFCLDTRPSIWQIALSYQFKSSWLIWLLHSINWKPIELKDVDVDTSKKKSEQTEYY